MKNITNFIKESLVSESSIVNKGSWHQWCDDVYEGNFEYNAKWGYRNPHTGKDIEINDKMDTYAIAQHDGSEQAAADLLASRLTSWTRGNSIKFPSNEDFKNLVDWFIGCRDKNFAEECAAEYLSGLLDTIDEYVKPFKSSSGGILKPSDKFVVLKSILSLDVIKNDEEKTRLYIAFYEKALSKFGFNIKKVKSGDYSELPDFESNLDRLIKKFPALKEYGL